MVLRGSRGETRGEKHEGKRMELRNGRGNEGEGKEMPVGKQMLAPFIGLFVGHDVPSGHETSRGFSLC